MRRKLTTIAIFGLLLIVVGALALAGCGEAEEGTTTTVAGETTTTAGGTETSETTATTAGEATGEPIKIGAVIPRTGGLEAWGDWIIDGATLALEEAGNQVAGRPIELVVRDDGSFDTVMALDSARELVEKEGVQFIFQDLVSGPFLAIQPYINENKIVSFAPDNRGEIVEWESATGDRYDICTAGAMTQGGYALGKFAAETLGLKTVTTLGQDYETGYQVIGAFVKGFTEAGGTVVQQQWAPGDTADFAPYLTGLKEADVFVTWFVGGGVNLVLKQFNDFGLYDKYEVMVGNPYNLEERLGELGDWAEGVYQASYYSPGYDSPMNADFVSAVEEKFGIVPNEMHVTPYEAIKVLLAAIEKTGGDLDPDKIRAAIIGTEYEGPTGKFVVTEEGFCFNRTQYINKIVKGSDGTLQWELAEAVPDVTYPGYFTKP